jgi:hypothetical protein
MQNTFPHSGPHTDNKYKTTSVTLKKEKRKKKNRVTGTAIYVRSEVFTALKTTIMITPWTESFFRI